MSYLPRRIGPIVFAVVLLATLVPIAAATDDLTVEQAEAKVATLLNQQRTDIGRIVLRVDTRLSAIARARSEDMATKGYFAHQQPDGDWAWDLMTAAGIKWYGAGEIIAWNTWGTLADSATAASKQWHDSSAHYALLTSASYNYFGVGVAVDSSGKKVWTVVFIKGPDRTGARSRFRTASNTSPDTLSTASTSTARREMTIKWSGSDVRLQVLTAGLKYFQVQVRREGVYDWRDTKSATTSTHMVRNLLKGRVYQFRIRAKDKAGNYGRWSSTLWIRP
jgi:uncharacterized protein YkwD